MYSFGEEFKQTLELLEEERNIKQDVFIEALCDAILAAYKKKHPSVKQNEGIKTMFDKDTCSIGIFSPLTVVEEVTDSAIEISLTEAQSFIEDIKLGEEVEVDVTPVDFSEYGRLSANVARQIVRQKLNEEEKRKVYDAFDKVKHTILVGQVTRVEDRIDGGNHVVVDLGNIEGLIPPKLQIRNHRYRVGERVRVYVQEIQDQNKSISIIVSQTHEALLLELFRLEIPEIDDGIIEIVNMAREAGRRAKIAVRTNESDVDPIGACIGARGSRIQNIIAEIGSEKIDIVPYSEDPVEFISYALSPTQISEIALFGDDTALVVVPEDQLSIAIGKGGQNVKLASRLTGWKLDIKSEEQAADAERKEELPQQKQATTEDTE